MADSNAEKPPLRALLGEFAAQYALTVYQQRLASWEEWKDLAIAAEGR